ncbi:oxalate:formate antiporter [Elysia marginata]|uniref:Oxalate:formate antiporter n=1 Tax=Elysia marginata TaxID=1093978 RepID=A0AAV4F6T8_9GAST|nr:oxalate:formate antiporter [Elysia marginata]
MAPLSFIWVYGNLSAYLDSYFRFSCTQDCMDGDSQWILGLCIAMMCPGTLITKYVADKVGLKCFGLVSTIVVNACTFAAAWVINLSVAGTAMLLGVVMGLAQGVGSVVAFQYVSGWAPDKSSLFMATTSGVPTLISMFQNQIVTVIVNPNNLKTDAMQGSRTYFSQKEVLDRVPIAIIAFGAMTLGFQLIGYLLLAPHAEPPTDSKLTKTTGKEIEKVTGDDKSFERELQNLESQGNGYDREGYGSNAATNSTLTLESNHKSFAQSTTRNHQENPTSSSQELVEKISLKPTEAAKTPVFYAVFMFGAATMYALLLKSNYYKQFGLLYIQNDQYLTLVGTLIPAVASLSRFSVGAALNKRFINIKDSLVISLTVNGVLCAFWYLVPQADSVLYMFFILLLSIVQSWNYVVLPVASLDIFGPSYFSTNYGLLQFSFFIVGILSPVVIPPLMNDLGWFWLFASATILCLLTLVLVVIADFNPSKTS